MSQDEKNNFWMPNKKYPEGLDPEYDELRRMQNYRDGNMTYYRPEIEDINIGFSVSTFNGEAFEWLIPDTIKSVGTIDRVYLFDENYKYIECLKEPIVYGEALWKSLTRNDSLASLSKEPYPYPTEEELREWEIEDAKNDEVGSRE